MYFPPFLLLLFIHLKATNFKHDRFPLAFIIELDISFLITFNYPIDVFNTETFHQTVDEY